MLICINRILISAWVFSLLLSPSEAQHCLDLAGEACALLGSSESCGPANLMGRGPLAGCHGVVYVRLLSAAFFLLVFFFSPFLLLFSCFCCHPSLPIPWLQLPLVQERQEGSWLVTSAALRGHGRVGWSQMSCPVTLSGSPPIQGQGWGMFLPQSQPAPCLLPSEHCSRRDETKPYRSHCLSDYKVLLIEGATNAHKRLCWTSILAQIKLQVGISLIVPDSDKYSSTVRRQPACPGQGKVASVLWEGTCVHWELLGVHVGQCALLWGRRWVSGVLWCSTPITQPSHPCPCTFLTVPTHRVQLSGASSATGMDQDRSISWKPVDLGSQTFVVTT